MEHLQTALSALFARAPQAGVKGVFQFVFAPDQASWVEVSDDVTIELGRHPSADTTIELSGQDFLSVATGEENIEELFALGRITIGGNLGLATLLPQMIEEAQAESESESDEEIETELNRRYPAPPRHSETVSAQSPPLRSIERRPAAEVSVAEFRERYLPTGTPLILRDALRDWPIFALPRSAALAHFDGLQGITRHGDYFSKAFSTERDFRTHSMASFIAALDDESAADGDVPAYMGNNIVPSQLIEQIRYPAYFDDSLYIPPRIWIGPKGTLTPLHRDDTDNLFAQVWGQKSFVLVAPHHRETLGTWSTSPEGGLEGCDFDPDAPDFARFPAARDVAFHRIVLEAGDLLFLPEGWFHQVRSVTTSLSVNFWVDSARRE